MPSRRLIVPLLGALILVLSLLPVPSGAGWAATQAPSPAAPSSPAAPGTTNGPGQRPPVIVVGTAGLRWDDIDPERTPNLWEMFQAGTASNVAVRSVRRAACPVDGWLAISSGRRASDVRQGGAQQCRTLPEPLNSTAGTLVSGWGVYSREAARGSYGAVPGLFGQQVAEEGVPATAIGPGAAIALSSPDGVLRTGYQPRQYDPELLTGQVRDAAVPSSLVVVDVGSVRDPDDLLPGDLDTLTLGRQVQVARIDSEIGAVRAGAPEGSTVLVASLADSGVTPHLQALVATGPTATTGRTYDPALAWASSTRQNGIVQTTDLATTVLALLGRPAPPDLPGAVIGPKPGTQGSAADRHRHLLDVAQAAIETQELIPPFFNGLVVAQILLYGGAALALRVPRQAGQERRNAVLAVLRRVALVFAAVPVSTFLANLIPWWRADTGLLAVIGAVAVFVALICTVALLGPWRNLRLGPLGFIGGVTAVVLAVDVITGSRLQIASLMGLPPLVAGRFYGLGNVQFALFSSGSLMLAVALADHALNRGRRWLAVTWVVLIGLVTVVIDGTPGLGSDFGGPPAIIPAFTLMALLVAGVKVTWRRVLMIAAGTVLAVVLISLGDWLRPAADRTHLGRFAQTVIEGGAWQVVTRKASANWAILTSSFLTVLLPFAAVFVAVFLMRPGVWGGAALQRTYGYAPALRHGLNSLIVLVTIGAVVNDSGTVVPAISAVLVVPLLIATAVRTLELEERLPPGQAGRAGGVRAAGREG